MNTEDLLSVYLVSTQCSSQCSSQCLLSVNSVSSQCQLSVYAHSVYSVYTDCLLNFFSLLSVYSEVCDRCFLS